MAEKVTKQGYTYEDVKKIADYLLSKTSHRPQIGIICGSGLGALVEEVENKHVFPYDKIPDFPTSTVVGHAGQLVFGELEGKSVVCMKGRFHLYEGHSVYKTAMPIRVLAQIGIKLLIVTNAAGGVNKDFNIGDIMVIRDHIGLPLLNCFNPLVGINDDRVGPRFPSFTEPYDKEIIKLILETAKHIGIDSFTKTGTYVMQSGPCFETPAEIRFLHLAGADAVGMSTVPEVVVARHAGVKVAGISLITNKAVHDYEDCDPPNHAEVLEVGKKRSGDIRKLIHHLLKKLEI
eukprot:gene18778-20669_t